MLQNLYKKLSFLWKERQKIWELLILLYVVLLLSATISELFFAGRWFQWLLSI